MIERIERLGQELERSWGKTGFAREKFSGLVFDLLRRERIHEWLTVEEIFSWLRQTKKIPRQLSMAQRFGQPPITLYWNEERRFLIDVYFWVTPEISIHSHGFQGAFTVLQGRSLNCRYTFAVKENFLDQVFVGHLLLQETHLMERGAIQEIFLGRTFIHRVWHIGLPTVSLAIRTDELGGRPQYNFLKPCIAYRYRDPTPFEAQTMSIPSLLFRMNAPEKEMFLAEVVSVAEPCRGIHYLNHYAQATGDLETVRRVLEGLSRHRRWKDPLLEALTYRKKMEARWKRISTERERLLLALLHTFTDRESILSFIKSSFPDESPTHVLTNSLVNLIREGAFPFELNETAFDILKLLLRGYGENEVCRRLQKSYGPKSKKELDRDIRTFCNRLRATELLKPLLLPRRRSGGNRAF